MCYTGREWNQFVYSLFSSSSYIVNFPIYSPFASTTLLLHLQVQHFLAVHYVDSKIVLLLKELVSQHIEETCLTVYANVREIFRVTQEFVTNKAPCSTNVLFGVYISFSS